MILELLISFLLVAGAGFVLVGSIGLARLPDVFMRLHGPTKATTLGVGGVLVGSMVFFSAESGVPSVHEILVMVFLFITAPVSAHLMAKAAIHRRCPARCPVPDPASGEDPGDGTPG